MNRFDVVILGGGAAGLMCGIAAGSRGRKVAVLEGSDKIGKKILISGGGRCNFTNRYCAPSHFLSENPNFCISALSRYSPDDFVALVEKHAIAYHEKTAGQLFCDHTSKEVLAMLVTECRAVQAEIHTHCKVSSVEKGERFVVATDQGEFVGDSLVIATGGLSFPKMGASDLGYRIARQFGHAVGELRAALVPFTFSGAMLAMTSRLSGISTRAEMTTDGVSFRGDILFTHRGVSGPAALQLSSYWVLGNEIRLNLLPDTELAPILHRKKLQQPKTLLRTVLSELLPRALVLELEPMWWPSLSDTRLVEIADKELERIASQFHNWCLTPSGTEGYRTAEVTRGGVATNQLSSKTMESQRQPGLYFIGEVVDVTGQLGGFNFQWAWASAQAAGAVV